MLGWLLGSPKPPKTRLEKVHQEADEALARMQTAGDPPKSTWNPEDVEALLNGDWNAYLAAKRALNKEYAPNFKGFFFSPANPQVKASKCCNNGKLYFKELNFNKVHFVDCVVRDSVFESCHMYFCSFINCSVIDCKFIDNSSEGAFKEGIPDVEAATMDSFGMRGGYIFNSVFERNYMIFSRFDGASITNCSFIDCIMNYARFEKYSLKRTAERDCELLHVIFYGCDLRLSHFTNAEINNCRFMGKSIVVPKVLGAVSWYDDYKSQSFMYGTDFSHSVIWDSYILLDNSAIKETIFARSEKLPLIELFRRFSGFSGTMNIILFVLFLMPVLAKVVYFTVLIPFSDNYDVLSNITKECDANCSFSILFYEAIGGLNAPIIVGLSFYLLIYNVYRFHVTSKVVRMREESELTKRTPYLQDYEFLLSRGLALHWSFRVAVLAGILNALPLLLDGVPALP